MDILIILLIFLIGFICLVQRFKTGSCADSPSSFLNSLYKLISGVKEKLNPLTKTITCNVLKSLQGWSGQDFKNALLCASCGKNCEKIPQNYKLFEGVFNNVLKDRPEIKDPACCYIVENEDNDRLEAVLKNSNAYICEDKKLEPLPECKNCPWPPGGCMVEKFERQVCSK